MAAVLSTGASHRLRRSHRRTLPTLLVAVCLTGCSMLPAMPGRARPAPVSAPASSGVGLMDVLDRPAERALLAGIRAYEDAQYEQAEEQFKAALGARLASRRDRAAAWKHLAFIYCTSDRVPQCEAAFRSAREADPDFALSKGEAGHPLWGPVYRRVLGAAA